MENIINNCDKCDNSSITTSRIPITVFIIICFIALIFLIFYKTYVDRFPSVSQLCSQTMCMIFSSMMIILVASISIYAEWICVVCFSLLIMMSIIGTIYPNIFIYPDVSN